MTDLEQQIRDAEAGPWLDALCMIAMDTCYGAKIVRGQVRVDDGEGYGCSVSPHDFSEWSAAGPALEWLEEQRLARGGRSVGAGIQAGPGSETHGKWSCFGTAPGYQCDGWADDPCLAIARAVCRIGIRYRPDEMQSAWESLTRGAGSTEQNQEADHD